jgi:[ribosomal protein S18]-alanine N-acetyltransferase
MVVNSKIALRAMVRADAHAVARVGFAAWCSNIPLPYDDRASTLEALRRNFEGFAQNRTDLVTVALIDGQIVGWGARNNRHDPGNLSSDVHHISDLWVDPAHQGQGIGSALLKAMTQEIARWHYTTATIDAAQSNLKALRFYARHGFQELERIRVFSKLLQTDVPVVILEKFLD